MTRTAKLVVYHPHLIVWTTLLVTVGFAAAIITRGVGFNGSPETLARNDSSLAFFEETRRSFGDDRVILVALTTSDVFSSEFIGRLDRLTRRLGALDGVAETISLTNLKGVRREGQTIRVDKLIPTGLLSRPDADLRLVELRKAVTADPLYARHYVSIDGRTAAINVFLRSMDEKRIRAVAELVERVARSEAGADELLLSGVPIIEARGVNSMFRDMTVLSPVAALLCFLVFLFSFRTIWGAVLPMGALLIGLIWTIGLMSLVGRPITLSTLALPTTLMAVGSSYIFHVLNQYRISMSSLDFESGADDKRRAWLDGVRFIAPAVLVSGTATMAGFGALATSAVPTVRDMGLFEALGVGGMLLLTMLFIPAALTLLPRNALGRQTRSDYVVWLNGWLRNITALALFRRRAVLAVFIVSTILIGAGAAFLVVNTDYLRIFPSNSETVVAAEKLHERLAGAATVQVVLTDNRPIRDPLSLLGSIDGLERFAMTRSDVDAAISVADILKRMNRELPGKPDETVEELPRDPNRFNLIMREYLLQDESISRLISRDLSRAVLVLRVSSFGSNELKGLTHAIDEWSGANLPAGISQRATGAIILLNDASAEIAESQASSLLLAIGSIYLMMVILFRSLGTAMLALIPNLLPIVGFFGFLGWSGIPLDMTTSLVASAALGLAVDNAVHMIRRYRQSKAQRNATDRELAKFDEGWVVWLTMLRTGKPMVLANLMLFAAFLVFVLSSFVPVRTAGVLWAVTILACLLSDLVFLPALIETRLFARAASGGVLRATTVERDYVEGVGIER